MDLKNCCVRDAMVKTRVCKESLSLKASGCLKNKQAQMYCKDKSLRICVGLARTQPRPAARQTRRTTCSLTDALIDIKVGCRLRRQIPVRLDLNTLAYLRVTVNQARATPCAKRAHSRYLRTTSSMSITLRERIDPSQNLRLIPRWIRLGDDPAPNLV